MTRTDLPYAYSWTVNWLQCQQSPHLLCSNRAYRYQEALERLASSIGHMLQQIKRLRVAPSSDLIQDSSKLQTGVASLSNKISHWDTRGQLLLLKGL